MRPVWIVVLAGCASSPQRGAPDAAADGAPDAMAACQSTVAGAPGQCVTPAECNALGDHVVVDGTCATLACCIMTPSVADNPPTPPGYQLMPQAQVTAEMTSWAVAILHDPVTYPMFSTAMMTFGALPVLARVEWHPPDFNNSSVHRGVTLYEPAPMLEPPPNRSDT